MEKFNPEREKERKEGWTRRDFLKVLIGVLGALMGSGCNFLINQESPNPIRPELINPIQPIEQKPLDSISHLIENEFLRKEDFPYFTDPLIWELRDGGAILNPKNRISIQDVQIIEQIFKSSQKINGELVVVEVSPLEAAILNFPPGKNQFLGILAKSGDKEIIIPAYWLNPQIFDNNFGALQNPNLRVIATNSNQNLMEIGRIINENEVGLSINEEQLKNLIIGKRIPRSKLITNAKFGRVIELRFDPTGNNKYYAVFLYNAGGNPLGVVQLPKNSFPQDFQNKIKQPEYHYILRHGIDEALAGEQISKISKTISDNLSEIIKQLSSGNKHIKISDLKLERLEITPPKGVEVYLVKVTDSSGAINYVSIYRSPYGNFMHFHINSAIEGKIAGVSSLVSAQERGVGSQVKAGILSSKTFGNLLNKYGGLITSFSFVLSIIHEIASSIRFQQIQNEFWLNFSEEDKKILGKNMSGVIGAADISSLENQETPVTGFIIINPEEIKTDGFFYLEPVYEVSSYNASKGIDSLLVNKSEDSSMSFGIYLSKEGEKLVLILTRNNGCFEIEIERKGIIEDPNAKVRIINLSSGKILVMFNLQIAQS